MYTSRLGKNQEKKLATRLSMAILGSIALLIFLYFFGLKILISFSLLVEKLKGYSQKDTIQSNIVIIQPPILDPLPIATNSANLIISGNGKSDMTLIISLNDVEVKKTTLDETGHFRFTDLPLKDGENKITAHLVDDKGNKSDDSNTVSTFISKKQPKLEISKPDEDAHITGEDNNIVTIEGITDPGNSVTLDGRVVVVNSDGSFGATRSLNEGTVTFTIIASDQAGNQTKQERKVTYQK